MSTGVHCHSNGSGNLQEALLSFLHWVVKILVLQVFLMVLSYIFFENMLSYIFR